MKISIKRTDYGGPDPQRWEWGIWTDRSLERGRSYPDKKGYAFTKRRAIKKAMKRLPVQVEIEVQ